MRRERDRIIAARPPLVFLPELPSLGGECNTARYVGDSASVATGDPVAVTVNVPAVPTVKLALFTLVIAGAVFTVSVKFCVAVGATPLWP